MLGTEWSPGGRGLAVTGVEGQPGQLPAWPVPIAVPAPDRGLSSVLWEEPVG